MWVCVYDYVNAYVNVLLWEYVYPFDTGLYFKIETHLALTWQSHWECWTTKVLSKCIEEMHS